MPNLSQKKRQRMLEFLNKIKEEHKNDDEMLIALGEIENELVTKKYGLVWEEHEENVDVQMRTNIPVFTEVKEREIAAAPGDGYNFLLEGDNLHSLYLLEKTHKGKIDLIYIDPPYNTGKKDDFVYDDSHIVEEDSFRHSKWLSFMYKRIVLAHSLLSAEGIIFISIDENEFAQLKLLCDSIFGEESFIECIIWNKRVPKNDKGIGNIHEYILLYAKSAEYKYKFMTLKDGLNKVYSLVNDCRKKKLPIKETEEKLKALYKKEKFDRAITLYNLVDEDYRIWGKINMSWPNGNTFGPRYDVLHPRTRKPVKVPDRGWRWNETTFNSVVDYTKPIVRYDGSYLCGGIWFSKDEKIQPSSVKYLDDVNRMLLRSIISIKSDGSIELEKFFGKKSTFSYPKSVILIKTLIDSITYNKKNSCILDFFAGSGTTAQAVLELNKEDGGSRRVILCTNNESNICDEVTYPRVKTIITGTRSDGSKYSEGLPANLKYYRTDFVPRNDEELSERLNEHIVEMIQLEHGVDIDGKEYIMILTDAEMDELEANWQDYPNAKALYISKSVMMTTRQTKKFDGVEIHIIPDYYFKFELKEMGEAW